jgi:hypothetical protein
LFQTCYIYKMLKEFSYWKKWQATCTCLSQCYKTGVWTFYTFLEAPSISYENKNQCFKIHVLLYQWLLVLTPIARNPYWKGSITIVDLLVLTSSDRRHDTEHNDMQQNDTLHEGLKCDPQYKWKQHNNDLPLCWVSLCSVSHFLWLYRMSLCRV